MSETYDLIIVGAGIVGAACALECARGGWRTLVLDRGPVGGGTTAAGMGHIVVMDDSAAQFALTNYSRRLWTEMKSQLPPAVAYNPCGTLWVAADDEEMAMAQRKRDFYEARGVRAEILDAGGVAAAEPNLRPGLAGGLLVMEDLVVDPPAATVFFLEEAKRAGAQIRTGTAVTALLAEGGVQLADGSRLDAGRTLNAGGPWSPALTPGLPVRKRKGYLVVTEPAPSFVRHQVVELGYLKSAHAGGADSVACNVQPRLTGELVVGSSRQFDVDDSAVDPVMLQRMLARAYAYLPRLSELKITRAWAGHRAATPDNLPIIGPSAASDRIWLATGHEGLGITTSLGTGRLLADLLLGRPTAIPADPFAPARFSRANAGSSQLSDDLQPAPRPALQRA
jgi:glycine/D-amino acid oxidase-like deaminating enzyme